MLLVSGSTRSVRRFAPQSDGRLGILLTPDTGNSVKTTVTTGLPWACDNAAYSGFDAAAYLRLLAKVVAAGGRPLWVAAPDVVGDAAETLRRFDAWEPMLRELGLPVALVSQDGLTAVPWGRIACLFVGGSDGWKFSPESGALCHEAKDRGLLVHVGRVNSLRRIEASYRLRADSTDGGSTAMYGDAHIPRYLSWMKHLERQPAMFR